MSNVDERAKEFINNHNLLDLEDELIDLDNRIKETKNVLKQLKKAKKHTLTIINFIKEYNEDSITDDDGEYLNNIVIEPEPEPEVKVRSRKGTIRKKPVPKTEPELGGVGKDDELHKIKVKFDSGENMKNFINKFKDEFHVKIGEITELTKSLNLMEDDNNKTFRRKPMKQRTMTDKFRKEVEQLQTFTPYYWRHDTMYSFVDLYFSKEMLKQWNTIFGKKITNKPNTTWWPPRANRKHRSTIYVKSTDNLPNQYPIYVISKSRYEEKLSLTANYLIKNKIKFNMIVEESQVEKYKEQEHLTNDYCNFLTLPQQFIYLYKTCDKKGDEEKKSKGSGPARNYAKAHSNNGGFEKHWIVDDNIKNFFTKYNQRKLPYRGEGFFRAIEDFTSQYPNVKMSGPQYTYFAAEPQVRSPLNFNTRIFSCILLDNGIDIKWRGRYNEDVLLSLDILENNYDTLQISFLLQDKTSTGTMKGGNADEIYKDGTKEKSELLAREYPKIAKECIRYDRDHHDVNYKGYIRDVKFVENKNISFYLRAYRIVEDEDEDDIEIDINQIP